MVNKEKFLEAFLKYEDDLRAFIAPLIQNRQDREDVFQETAMTLWRKFDEYDPQRPFGAWAKGVAVNKTLQFRTKSGRVPTPFSPETIGAIAEAVERRESRQPPRSAALDALDRCKKILREQSRVILTLRYCEKWSIAQIAERLDSTPTAVTMSLSRIRADLYNCMQRELGHDRKQKQ